MHTPRSGPRRWFVHPVPAAIAAAVLMPLVCPGQTVLRVNAAAGPGGNGLSWPTAYNDLQSALDAAAPIAGGGSDVQIWVAGGRYLPTRTTVPGIPQSATFRLASRVALLGGFVGTETMANQRNPGTNVTILSGDLDGDAVPGDIDNARHVVSGAGVDATAVIDGFTIADGVIFGPSFPEANRGGGLWLVNASPTIRGCTLRGHGSIASTDPSGSAVYTEGGSPTFTGCDFIANAAPGGIVFRAASGAVTMHDCEFLDNTALGLGVCAGIYGAAALTLTECRFVHGVSSANGAITALGPLLATECSFTDCLGGTGVGAVDLIAGSTARFVRCKFMGNGGSSGGGVRGDGEFIACSFIGNMGFSFGAGAVNGRGTYVNCEFRANSGNLAGGVFGRGSFINCIVNGNTGGGGLRLVGDDDRVINCTIISNGGRGVRYGGTGQLTIANSILWNNSLNNQTSESTQIDAPTSSLVLRHSYVQGLTGSLGGVGNLGGPDRPSPGLVNPLGDDGLAGTGDDLLGLAGSSWCIDAGDNTMVALDAYDLDQDSDVLEGHPIDMGNHPRFRDDAAIPDIGIGAAPLADIGAMEYQGASCRADWNRDGRITPADVAAFVNQWFDALISGSLAPDYDRNGAVQPADIAVFIGEWMAASTGLCPAP